MKSLVIYDSVHGNTEKIAEAIAAVLGDECTLKKASEAGPEDLSEVKLLVVGSPTYAGRPTDPMKAFLDKISGVSLKGVNIACFDTRLPSFWVKLFGFASKKIDNQLSKLGGLTVMGAAGFFVTGSKKPLLVEKEIKRAEEWAIHVHRASAF